MGLFGIGEEVKDVSDGVGNLVTDVASAFTGEIPPKAKIALAEIQKKLDDNVTTRWVSDSNSVAKYIRPLSLLVSLVMYFIFIALDNPHVDSIESLVEIMVIAYFGSRGIEKIKGATK